MMEKVVINHIGTQPITTKRLFLRRFTKNDYKDAFEKWTNSYDSRFWEPLHKSIEETKKTINEYVKMYKNNNYYMWTIIFENKLVGLVCGNEINENIKSICIGYCITKSYWNKGIATEASKALIIYFFNMGFNRVFRTIIP
jgi:ribosomal-protein-alanine N-acetyltransferase